MIVEKDYFFLVKLKYFDDLEHATRIQKRRLNLLFSYQFKYYSCFQKLNKTIRYLWHKKTRIWVIFRYSSKAIYIINLRYNLFLSRKTFVQCTWFYLRKYFLYGHMIYINSNITRINPTFRLRNLKKLSWTIDPLLEF